MCSANEWNKREIQEAFVRSNAVCDINMKKERIINSEQKKIVKEKLKENEQNMKLLGSENYWFKP